MISINKRILKVLKIEELTTEQVAEKIGVDKKILWKYMSTLLNKKKKIIKTNDKKPYTYTSITKGALLHRIYNIMIREMTKKPKAKISKLELKLVDIIGEMVENE